jgi:hypothetical protein
VSDGKLVLMSSYGLSLKERFVTDDLEEVGGGIGRPMID